MLLLKKENGVKTVDIHIPSYSGIDVEVVGNSRFRANGDALFGTHQMCKARIWDQTEDAGIICYVEVSKIK